MSISKPSKSWEDIPGVEIFIVRGEDIVYREGGREYSFQISCLQHPLILFAGGYRDENCAWPKVLTEEEYERIIPRLVACLGRKGEPVEVRDQ